MTTTSYAHPATAPHAPMTARQMLNKVPEITLYFWVIKILCTTVGETAADYLNETLGLGLTVTTLIMTGFLAASLVLQFWLRRYVPFAYWLAVVLISVVGTLITDNLTDNFGVSLVTTTIVFGVALAVTFAAWYARERTLSIHTIVTTRREAFYWLAVLFTFALGTAAGDLTAERLAVGYWKSALLFGALIAVVTVLHRWFRLNAILAFWIAYILTRPLGASIGDYMSQPREDGGRGLGTTVTSVIFLATILAVVVYLTVTRKDTIEAPEEHEIGLWTANGVSAVKRVLVMTEHPDASPRLIDALRARAAAGPADFFMLVPNPHHAFDRIEGHTEQESETLAHALPSLREATGVEIDGIVSHNPNAYDGIVAELEAHQFDEIILETHPSHLSHWLHIDLPGRIERLGYPVTTVAAAH